MGMFDGLAKVAGALSGQNVRSGGGTLNKVGIDSRPMDTLRAGKLANMARMGLNPDGSPMKAQNKLLTPKRATTILKGNIQ
jgi:hypothetical protein